MAEGIQFLKEYQQRELARKYQKWADRFTAVRLLGALPLSATMAASKPSWVTTIANGFLWATDKFDGYYAKKAQKIWPSLERTKMSKRDPFADKEMQYGNEAAVMNRSINRGDTETAIVMGTNMAVSAWRDRRMDLHRTRAREHGVNPDAIRINKIKTGAIAVSNVVLLSPLANNERVRRGALVARTAATVIGIAGEQQFGGHIDASIDAKMAGVVAAETPVAV